MILYIFTGPPASGKSSFVKDTSRIFNIKYFSKDEIKVELFEKIGFNNHGEKKKLSKTSEKILKERIIEELSKSNDVIVDNNFKNFDDIRDIKKCFKDLEIKCVYLTADYKVLAERYNKRISSGNRDVSLYTLNVYPVVDGVSIFHEPIDEKVVEDVQNHVEEKTFGDKVLEVDTTYINKEYNKLLKKIVKFMEG